MQMEAQKEHSQKVEEVRELRERERQQQLIKQADTDNAISKQRQEQLRREREAQFNKKRLALLGLEEEESKSALHRNPTGDVMAYPGRELDSQNASLLQKTVHTNMVAL